jgi:hypothetical protein
MINQELIQYIQQACARGDTKEMISKTLLENGWNDEDIVEGLKYCGTEMQAQPVKTEKPKTTVGTNNVNDEKSFSWSVQKKEDDQKNISKQVSVKTKRSQKDEEEDISDEHKTKRIARTIIVILLFLGAFGAAGYYIVTQTGIFNPKPLSNENVLGIMVEKINTIGTADYYASLEIKIDPRDTNAKPLTLSEQDLLKYKRDEDRMRDIQQIVDKLKALYGQQQHQNKNTISGKKVAAVIPKYPTSLESLSLKTIDPLGVSYEYAATSSNMGYTLTAVFETQEAVDSFNSPYAYYGSNTATVIKGKMVTITDKSYFYANDFIGKPAQPKFFGFFDLAKIETYISADTKGKMFVSGTVDNSKDIPTDAKFVVGADSSFGDANFAFEAEGVKKGDNFFGIIHKLPTFFSSLGQIRGTWVMMTKEDILSFIGDTVSGTTVPISQDDVNKKVAGQRAQMKILLNIASEDGVVAVSPNPEIDKVDGEKMFKYKISLVKEKILPFYEHATKKLETYGKDSILPRDEKTVEYLKGDDFSRTFNYLKESTQLTLWINKEGFPAKMEVVARYIPSSDVVALKEKQIDLTTTISLKNINKPVVVEEPKQYVTIYEMLANITGQSKTLLLATKQEVAVDSIQNALASYNSWAGRYPSSLDELKKKRKDVPVTTGSEYQSLNSSDYYRDTEFLKNVPLDVFTQKTFPYNSLGKDYRLTYQMEVDMYTRDKDPHTFFTEVSVPNSATSSVASYTTKLNARFITGTNTANKNILSVEADKVSQDDSDNDGLPNILETLFGTDAGKADTDGDGFSDVDELKAGTDPTGPGKLKYKSLYRPFSF